MRQMEKPITVGADGSPSSLDAAAWAGEEAALRGAPVHVIHAALEWTYYVPLTPQPEPWGPAQAEAVQELLQKAANRARVGHPDVQVTTEVVDSGPWDALVAAAESAQMIVVGSRGLGGFTGLLLGSVSRHVVTRATCPAVVVREPRAHSTGEIVAGVTGRSDQVPVLNFAFREAELRGASLRLLHAWIPPAVPTLGGAPPITSDLDAIGRSEQILLAEAAAGWQDKFPDVRVIHEVVCEHPAKALIDASAEHDLTVIGAHGGLRAMLGMGSIAHALVHHARGPVVVVRH
ncbi:universal stress protein [Sphaerimonospora sp. CA-214678]|uniref:universal stress protein n=1 Tax=Sphaerimonospora sp. CA-214678 TaxID=3240029 RepID=UPI003D917C5E